MDIRRLVALSLASVFIPLAAASCGSEGTGGGSGGNAGSGGGGTGGAGGGAAASKWYTTCGDPVCGPGGGGPGGAGSGVPACTTEKAGDPCAAGAAQCDPGTGCGVLLVCATSDPKMQPGGCPISLAKYKKEISYLPEADLNRVHDDLVAMRLATWRYVSEPAAAREHLGFMIDDNPSLPAVHASGDQVDLYGYTSMAVAAIQVQAKQIDDLKAELSALREELRAARSAGAPSALRGKKSR